MNKAKISLQECKDGMRLAEDVMNNYGAVISRADSTIDDNLIARLKLNDINYITVYADIQDKTKSFFNKIHKENVGQMKKLMQDISDGKPIAKEPFRAICDNIIQFTTQSGSIASWLNQIKTVDSYTYSHCVNVGTLNFIIGKWLDFDEEKLQQLTYCGLLHDIGKSMIDPEILNKPDKLSEEEFAEMKKHPTIGYRLIKDSQKFHKSVSEGILMHHERNNGEGYPLGLNGKQINVFGKITAIADIYDAMTSDKVYSEKSNPFKVFEMMQSDIFGLLDPEITLVFIKNMANYYIGSNVMLSDGRTVKIVFINSNDIAHPIVADNGKVVNLSQQHDLEIIGLI